MAEIRPEGSELGENRPVQSNDPEPPEAQEQQDVADAPDTEVHLVPAGEEQRIQVRKEKGQSRTCFDYYGILHVVFVV